MPKISIYLAASLMIVTGVVGVAAGYWLTPQYTLSMYDKSEMDLGRPDKWLDLRYINAMIAHHRGAMLVAEQLKKSERQEMKDLSAAILKGEPALIAELYQWKKDWYGDSRLVQDPVVPAFGEYDKTFDLRVLNTIIAHHQNGIQMTRDVRVKTSRSEIANNADAVEEFLSGGVVMLKEWRKNWYGI
jgi:uncharacterized protein (DUF305 family)